MKKYACNRLYVDDRYLSQAVVVINDNGEVESYSSFSEEMPETEWIGGVILLSCIKDRVQCDGFHHFRKQMTNAKQCVYAWHISHFDFQKEEFTPQSIIHRL